MHGVWHEDVRRANIGGALQCRARDSSHYSVAEARGRKKANSRKLEQRNLASCTAANESGHESSRGGGKAQAQ